MADPTVETTVTEKKTGEAATSPTPAPAAVADDTPRFYLGLAVVIQFVAVIAYMIYTSTKLDNTQMILGAEITFMTTVLNYYFGSSSGSTTKSALLESKKP
jgi:hypothetical protein